jgi:sugar O-acyltransferase (sialic acid O-acetyltransferase NeuD family)
MQIFGASGHAKVIIECLEANSIPITAIFDDDKSKLTVLGYSVSHNNPMEKEEIIIAIGNNLIRKEITVSNNFKFGIAIHPSALLSNRAKIGKGTVVFHKAIIQSDVKIGEHCIINTAATIDHDCTIDNFVHIAPGVTICGNVSIGELTLVGAGTIILPNLIIGKNCIIGAGSVIICNIPDNTTVFGNPAKIKNKND